MTSGNVCIFSLELSVDPSSMTMTSRFLGRIIFNTSVKTVSSARALIRYSFMKRLLFKFTRTLDLYNILEKIAWLFVNFYTNC